MVDSATQGFLPPNDQNGAGKGVVGYTIQPKANSANTTRIDAQASIIFNSQTPIQTNPVFNTLDSAAPISQVIALPTNNTNPNFTVAWTGTDTGSGIGSYDIYVSTDGSQYVLWRDNITTTSAIYNGQVGKSYAFYSVATDNLGQAEAAPNQADTTTTIVNTIPTISIADLQVVEGQSNNALITVTLSNPSTQTVTVKTRLVSIPNISTILTITL